MERRVRALTPDDIVNYPLKQAVRGYSVRQVDDLLDRVADELERVHHEVADTRQRLAQAEARAETLSEAESTLKRTLVTAQRAAEQIMAEAHERAATVVEQAQQEAERQHRAAVNSAREELDKVRRDQRELATRVEALREFERDYRSTLRSLVERHLRALDELEQRVAPSLPEAEQPDEAVRADSAGAGVGGQEPAGPPAAAIGGHDAEPQQVDEDSAGFPAASVEEDWESRSALQATPSGPEPIEDLVEEQEEEQESDGAPTPETVGDGQKAADLDSKASGGVLETGRREETPGIGRDVGRWPAVDLSRGEHLRRQVEEAFSQVLTGLDDEEEEKQAPAAMEAVSREPDDRETVVVIHETKRRRAEAAEDGRAGERA